MNSINVTGVLTYEPELRAIPTNDGEGKYITTFLLRVDREYLSKERKEELRNAGKQTADFFRVEVKTGQAVSCSKHLVKNSLVSVSGRLKNTRYEKDIDGTKHVYHLDVIEASNVEFLDFKANNNRDNKGNNIDNSDQQDDARFIPVEGDGDIPF